MHSKRPTLSLTPAIRLAKFLSCLLLCLTAPARAGTEFYALGNGPGLSALYTVDPATGTATLLWDLPGLYLYAGGLAYDPESDTLFATGSTVADSASRLFTINRFTGAVTMFPGLSPTINLTSGGLALHPLTGVLYATGGNGFQSTALFTMDKLTGAATLVGQNGGQCCVDPFGFMMNGLGFRDDGTLFANGFTLSGASLGGAYSHLFTIDLASGLATDIGSHGVAVGRLLAYSGLAFGPDGTLYSLGSIDASIGGLYSVDPATGHATLIGPSGPPIGVDGALVFAPDGLPTEHCTAKLNSQGCLPAVGWSGAPSAGSAAPFLISAANVINQKPGLMIYGTSGKAALPFQGGTLCVAPPVTRTALQLSGGTAGPDDCSGTFSLDFNVWIQAGLDPALVPGETVSTQYWYRDPSAAFGSGLTDALAFTIAV